MSIIDVMIPTIFIREEEGEGPRRLPPCPCCWSEEWEYRNVEIKKDKEFWYPVCRVCGFVLYNGGWEWVRTKDKT